MEEDPEELETNLMMTNLILVVVPPDLLHWLIGYVSRYPCTNFTVAGDKLYFANVVAGDQLNTLQSGLEEIQLILAIHKKELQEASQVGDIANYRLVAMTDQVGVTMPLTPPNAIHTSFLLLFDSNKLANCGIPTTESQPECLALCGDRKWFVDFEFKGPDGTWHYNHLKLCFVSTILEALPCLWQAHHVNSEQQLLVRHFLRVDLSNPTLAYRWSLGYTVRIGRHTRCGHYQGPATKSLRELVMELLQANTTLQWDHISLTIAVNCHEDAPDAIGFDADGAALWEVMQVKGLTVRAEFNPPNEIVISLPEVRVNFLPRTSARAPSTPPRPSAREV